MAAIRLGVKLKGTLNVVEAGIREYGNGDGRSLEWEKGALTDVR
jgi:hypothetical protein